MRRLAQLIRNLFSVKCSETEALRHLLLSDPMAATPRKLGASGGGLIRTTAGIFLAMRVAVTDLIVYCNRYFAQAGMNVCHVGGAGRLRVAAAARANSIQRAPGVPSTSGTSDGLNVAELEKYLREQGA